VGAQRKGMERRGGMVWGIREGRKWEEGGRKVEGKGGEISLPQSFLKFDACDCRAGK